MKSLRATATASCLALLAIAIVGAYLFIVISLQRASVTSPWITGDWLINYSSGFVRRGAVGEVARRLYLLAAVDPLRTIIAIKVFCYAALCAALLILVVRRKISTIELALLVSPAALPFEVYDPLGSGRKEIVLPAVFAIYVVADQLLPRAERQSLDRVRFWFLFVALPFLTLVHEGLFLFLPFFLAYDVVTRGLRREHIALYAIPVSAATLVLLGSWIYRGDTGISAAMCASFTSMSLDTELCGGAITALEHYQVNVGGADLTRYLILAGLTFGPLLFYADRVLDSARYPSMKLAILLAVAFTMPLYVLSEDWGRWMHITTMLIVMIVLASRDVPMPLPTERPVLAVASVIAASVYVIAWQLPHWIHSSLPMVRAAL